MLTSNLTSGAHTALPSAVIKRQVLALVIFVGVAWSRFIDHPDYATEIRESDQDVQRLVALMLETVLSKGAADDVGLGDVKAVARRSLHLGIGATPATQFAASILTMTQSSDATVSLLSSTSYLNH